jgi:2-keto-4-pentenoate hydratase/2-oxohepta-3-ene-1,7-dioic acid hydratase in catechol pathway
MRLATFIHRGAEHVGVVDAGQAFPLDIADMTSLIERPGDITGLLETASAVPLDDVQLVAPISSPRRNIICVGKNYRDHAREFSKSGFEAGAVAGSEIDSFPAIFTKLPTSVTGPDALVSLHSHITSSVDYEAELAVVIGKGGRDIVRADAFDHVFGYTIVNDVTARDRQKNHKQWFLGKTLDGFCPMGPWITTANEVDSQNLDIRCWVNGELRQSANTRDLIFDIPTLIATISAGTTLLPGDIIATGTPAGVGIGFNPPKFLIAGDTVKVSIAGLGELSNTFQ